jgi:hypothetical protein
VSETPLRTFPETTKEFSENKDFANDTPRHPPAVRKLSTHEKLEICTVPLPDNQRREGDNEDSPETKVALFEYRDTALNCPDIAVPTSARRPQLLRARFTSCMTKVTALESQETENATPATDDAIPSRLTFRTTNCDKPELATMAAAVPDRLENVLETIVTEEPEDAFRNDPTP